MISGILSVDKSAGMTSFDVVRATRRIFNERRVGHAGTLDPVATGVLPICVGQATRLVDYFHQQPKTYQCIIELGKVSTTLDTEGEITVNSDASNITIDDVTSVLRQFVGEIQQLPPLFSAVRQNGKHLYELARAGEEVDRTPRSVQIYAIELMEFRPGQHAEIELRIKAGKGAYMRSLAADVAAALGVGGYLLWLRRLSYGPLAVEDSVTMEALEAMEDPSIALRPMGLAVEFLPQITVAGPVVRQISHGQSVWLPKAPQLPAGGLVRLHSATGNLVAIGECAGGLFRPQKVLI